MISDWNHLPEKPAAHRRPAATFGARRRFRAPVPRDSFVRETFTLPRDAARVKAREWFDAFPKAAYWTQVESWRLLSGGEVEFTMRRLPTAD